MLLKETLKLLPTDDVFSRINTLCEDTVKVASFQYEKGKNDPTPKVIILGKWQHPRTKNKLICGINLNYLDQPEQDALMQGLGNIMTKDTLKAKYWEGVSEFPAIFRNAYRTYDEKYIDKIKVVNVEVPEVTPDPDEKEIEPLSKTKEPEKPEDKERDRKPMPLPKDTPVSAKSTDTPKPSPEAPKASPEGSTPQSTPTAPSTPKAPPSSPSAPPRTPTRAPDALPPPREIARQPVEPEEPPKPRKVEKKELEPSAEKPNILKRTWRKAAELFKRLIHKEKPLPKKAAKEVEAVHDLEDKFDKPKTPKDEVERVNDLEDKFSKPKTPKDEVDKLGDIEDEHHTEGFANRLDVILERLDVIPKDYKRAHSITSYVPTKSMLNIVYNTVTDEAVFDSRDPKTMCELAKWNIAECVLVKYDGSAATTICEDVKFKKFASSDAALLLYYLMD